MGELFASIMKDLRCFILSLNQWFISDDRCDFILHTTRLFHGYGSMSYSDGSTYAGIWREGKRVEGIETSSNGDVYEGEWLNGRFKAPWKVAHN